MDPCVPLGLTLRHAAEVDHLRTHKQHGGRVGTRRHAGAAPDGSGTDNGALTPYQQVFTDFERYAQTSLDRGYVPLSVKDYVRDYFSSLDPSN
jgi:hypothetical protein